MLPENTIIEEIDEIEEIATDSAVESVSSSNFVIYLSIATNI